MNYTEMVDKIVGLGLPLSKIILFGSVARGEDTIRSDIDIGFVLPRPVTRPQRRMITRVVSEYETLESMRDINCFYATDEEFITAARWSDPCLGMREEGVVLWER
ncbi:MAG: nucleotidyltransferase domain-containing protein [Defluviitaleaceae bacterium]|nr:nucleotidyltransferase domain-containing protein [Defluviitaleaceae bacterium]